jgi:hypothetical protein
MAIKKARAEEKEELITKYSGTGGMRETCLVGLSDCLP